MPIKSTGQQDRLEFLGLAWLSIGSLVWLTIGGPAWLPILIVLIFLGFGLGAGRLPFRRTPFDLALVLFWLMALVGVWAAYQRQTAWDKFWMLSLAILIYYGIASQPLQNFWWLNGLLGFVGLLLSLNFLFAFDWRALLADFRIIKHIGLAWMAVRPALPGHTLLPNNAAGILAGLFPFSLALGMAAWQQRRNIPRPWLLVACAVCFAGTMALTIFLTSSRGAWIALASGLVFWLVLALSERLLTTSTGRQKFNFVLGWTVMTLLVAGLIFILFGGLAQVLDLVPGLHTGQSRLDIDELTLHLLGDYLFTGSGLGSFPGNFSEYMLVIPSIMARYSHNLYLDVALEQGLLGLILLVGVISGSAILLSRSSQGEHLQPGLSLMRQAALVSLVVMAIHGLIDDPFYGEQGTPFVWIVAGLAAFVHPEARSLVSLFPVWINPRSGSLEVQKRARAVIGLIALGLVIIAAVGWRSLAASVLANLGAVRMAQVQLSDFPTNQWSDGHIAYQMGEAQRLFEEALQLDPANRTANHRLGLINMLRRDYPTAIDYLDAAYQQDPRHRGVIKNLGYSYVWAGQYDRAQTVLTSITEARKELGVYTWWWGIMGRRDLSQNAERMVQLLSSAD